MTKNIEKQFANISPVLDPLFEVCDPAEMEKLGKFSLGEKAQHLNHSMAQLSYVVTFVRMEV